MLNNVATQPQIVIGLIYACGALTAVAVLFAVILLINVRATNRLKVRYDSLMGRENADGMTLEQLIEECLDKTNTLNKSYSSIKDRVSSLENSITGCFQKIGIVRYNPFDDTGGDLSYTIALLDDTNSGFILNGIYSRAGSYTYAKQIENGLSKAHKLSPEELEALQLAIRRAGNIGTGGA